MKYCLLFCLGKACLLLDCAIAGKGKQIAVEAVFFWHEQTVRRSFVLHKLGVGNELGHPRASSSAGYYFVFATVNDERRNFDGDQVMAKIGGTEGIHALLRRAGRSRLTDALHPVQGGIAHSVIEQVNAKKLLAKCRQKVKAIVVDTRHNAVKNLLISALRIVRCFQ